MILYSLNEKCFYYYCFADIILPSAFLHLIKGLMGAFNGVTATLVTLSPTGSV